MYWSWIYPSAFQLFSLSLNSPVLLSDISRYGESNHHLHDNSGPRQPCSAPNTQQAPTHGCPKRCCLCVCVVNTQGVLEKQPNYRSVIYAIAGPCLQLLCPSLFIRRILIAISVLPPFQIACIIRCASVSTYRIFLKLRMLFDVR